MHRVKAYPYSESFHDEGAWGAEKKSYNQYNDYNSYTSESTDTEDKEYYGNGHAAYSRHSGYSDLSRGSSGDSLDYLPNHPHHGFEPRTPPYAPIYNPPSKCRQLPCRTFISTGSCPYGERCVFLHDASIVSKPIYIRSKRKSRDDAGVDAFFWPTMPMNAVMSRPDTRNMPAIAQPYIVPAPNSYTYSSSNNDVSVYSMWEHFLDFCKTDSLSVVTVPRSVQPQLTNPFARTNIYSGKARLSTFMRLSQLG
ncbi:hypothetical protein B484DRAFT_476588 [Ochromonadaceae sp. CCMP2298]|nr:hypothetical protein B484DRAFT_476588 [Ochromonadaceae sp. CCMP2298]